MTANPITVGPFETMDVAEGLFEKHGIHHLPVVENGRLVGVVSQTDLLKITRQLFGDALETQKNTQVKQSITAQGLMSKITLCVAPDSTLGEVLRMFRGGRFHSLPVIEGPEKRLVGIVTTVDLLRVFEDSLVENEETAVVL